MAEDTTLTHRLMDKLEEMGRSITRIEEQVKPIGDIKKDVDVLKISMSETNASTKSAHKRLDAMDTEIEKLPTKANYDDINERVKGLERNRNWIVGVVMGAVIVAVLSLVIIQN